MLNIFHSTKLWAKEQGLNTYCADKLGSTNSFAKDSSEGFDLIIADKQTAGKGRNSNTWTSPNNGDGLLSSFIFNFTSTPQPISTALVGLCLYRNLKSTFSDLNWSIKAPNDIWLDDKKIAGILCETLSSGDKHKLIIGIGINFLSHPNLDTAISIPKNKISEKLYLGFLNSFYTDLKTISKCFLKPELSSQQSKELLKALNNCPHYKNPVLEISPQCDIVFEQETLNWYSL